MCKKFLLAIFLLLFSQVTTLATVCLEHGLEGFDAAAIRAKSILPPETSDIANLSIYIEVDPSGGFYYHSNFKKEGALFPTKIGREPLLLEVEWAAQNIVWAESPDTTQRLEVQTALDSTAKIYLDRSVFKEDGTTDLKLDGITEFVILDQNSKLSTAAVSIKRENPPPILAERIFGCCLNGRPVGKARELALALTNLKMNAADTKVISFVADNATIEAAKSSGLDKKSPLLSGAEPLSLERIRGAFAEQQGKQIVALGHVEDGSFVVRNSAGSATSSFRINDLRKIADEYNVLLIEIGCNTASVGEGVAGPGVGVMTRFNTVDATIRLSKALEATSVSEFLQKLSSEDLKVVVEAAAIENQLAYRAEYFEKDDWSGAHYKLADVTIRTKDNGIFGSWTPNWLIGLFR